jgi:hypothetical protein
MTGKYHYFLTGRLFLFTRSQTHTFLFFITAPNAVTDVLQTFGYSDEALSLFSSPEQKHLFDLLVQDIVKDESLFASQDQDDPMLSDAVIPPSTPTAEGSTHIQCPATPKKRPPPPPYHPTLEDISPAGATPRRNTTNPYKTVRALFRKIPRRAVNDNRPMSPDAVSYIWRRDDKPFVCQCPCLGYTISVAKI